MYRLPNLMLITQKKNNAVVTEAPKNIFWNSYKPYRTSLGLSCVPPYRTSLGLSCVPICLKIEWHYPFKAQSNVHAS
jgi:hypothetical protein